MKSELEIQKAHDVLEAFIIGDVIKLKRNLSKRNLMMMSAACSALCWVLGDAEQHPPGQQLADMINALEKIAVEQGYSLGPPIPPSTSHAA